MHTNKSRNPHTPSCCLTDYQFFYIDLLEHNKTIKVLIKQFLYPFSNATGIFDILDGFAKNVFRNNNKGYKVLENVDAYCVIINDVFQELCLYILYPHFNFCDYSGSVTLNAGIVCMSPMLFFIFC